MQHYSKLRIWQRSHRLVLAVYRATKVFPVEERYGLTSQLRRAALSVPANVVEGSKRASSRDYSHFLNIAEGSLAEAEYLILVSRDLKYIAENGATQLLSETTELQKMLHSFRKTLEQTP